MKRTYNRTMCISEEELQNATITVYLTEDVKWEDRGERIKAEYTGLKSWSILDGEDGDELVAETDGTCIDELGEYLVLDFVDGTRATFRNSHADMFIR